MLAFGEFAGHFDLYRLMRSRTIFARAVASIGVVRITIRKLFVAAAGMSTCQLPFSIVR
jgi:hypothetical protein